MSKCDIVHTSELQHSTHMNMWCREMFIFMKWSSDRQDELLGHQHDPELLRVLGYQVQKLLIMMMA